MRTKRKERCARRAILGNFSRAHVADSQTPLYNDVRDVVISKRMSIILVSFQQVGHSTNSCLSFRILLIPYSFPGRTPALETPDHTRQEPDER